MSELYGSIKIDNGVRKIGVNDNGDYIEISVNDGGLHTRFAELIAWFDKKQEEVHAKGEELVKKHGDGPIISGEEDGTVNINTAAIVDVTNTEVEVYKEISEKIDEVFGKDTCKKVFGDVIPNFVLISDFFEQMSPIMQKLSEERGEKLLNRYNRRKLNKAKGKKQRSKEELISDYKEK